ncbi:transketolase family protein [Sporomusa malonica]|uniref:Transketolase subunit B n=1 Tax=Sporomusa malonica TaxID=112901 RepID=A0A1W2DLX6_9FIRM|nr:transketolase C-terminal domain-containing protein [Sporomusa malonica]SMC98006.1 transketolase subunit B [Sporomusa malonica]
MRDQFTATLKTIAEKDKNVVLVTGDLGFGVLKSFWEELPHQFINAGISEQAMTGMAAGMAIEGKTVFTYSIGNFPTLRCIEQIRNDCTYHNANVKIVCVGGGFVYGSLGMSHHATEDLAMMRALPNLVVMAPGDLVEAECATKAIYEYPGTCYLRLGRGGEKRIHNRIDNFQIGKAIKILEGEQVVLFSTGAIVDEVHEACDILKKSGITPAFYTFPTVKPIDLAVIRECAGRYDLIVTVEEHNIVGGFGSSVAEVLAELKSRKARMLKIGLNDTYSSIVGTQQFLRDYYGMSARKISQIIKGVVNE